MGFVTVVILAIIVGLPVAGIVLWIRARSRQRQTRLPYQRPRQQGIING